jgi:hypothetical protein
LAEHQAKGIRTPHEDPTNPAFFWGGGGQPSDANLEKPLICAINGLAVGVGFTLALQCQHTGKGYLFFALPPHFAPLFSENQDPACENE